VHSNEGDGGDRIRAGRWGILKGLAANIEAAHECSVGRTIEEAAAFGVAVGGRWRGPSFFCAAVK